MDLLKNLFDDILYKLGLKLSFFFEVWIWHPSCIISFLLYIITHFLLIAAYLTSFILSSIFHLYKFTQYLFNPKITEFKLVSSTEIVNAYNPYLCRAFVFLFNYDPNPLNRDTDLDGYDTLGLLYHLITYIIRRSIVSPILTSFRAIYVSSYFLTTKRWSPLKKIIIAILLLLSLLSVYSLAALFKGCFSSLVGFSPSFVLFITTMPIRILCISYQDSRHFHTVELWRLWKGKHFLKALIEEITGAIYDAKFQLKCGEYPTHRLRIYKTEDSILNFNPKGNNLQAFQYL